MGTAKKGDSETELSTPQMSSTEIQDVQDDDYLEMPEMLDADFGCRTAGEWRCRMEEFSGCQKMPEEPGDAGRLPGDADCRRAKFQTPKS